MFGRENNYFCFRGKAQLSLPALQKFLPMKLSRSKEKFLDNRWNEETLLLKFESSSSRRKTINFGVL